MRNQNGSSVCNFARSFRRQFSRSREAIDNAISTATVLETALSTQRFLFGVDFVGSPGDFDRLFVNDAVRRDVNETAAQATAEKFPAHGFVANLEQYQRHRAFAAINCKLN